MECDVTNCISKATVAINFNGNRTYHYCHQHNKIKGRDWVQVAGWAKSKEGKRYWKESNFHPANVERL